MSCNTGKTKTKCTVNSQVFVILFWFLVEHFKLPARTKDARDTWDAFLESVYLCIQSRQSVMVASLMGSDFKSRTREQPRLERSREV